MKLRIKIILSFLCMLLFCVGCREESSSSPSMYSIGPERANVSKLSGKAIEIVKEGLEFNSHEVRSYAIEVVSTTRQMELMPYVTRMLRSNSVPVRFSAAIAVGDTRYSGGEFAVKRLLKDVDENVRIAAAYAMTKFGRRGLSDSIRQAVKSKDQTVRANATLLLGKLGDKDDIPLLYSLLKQGKSTERVKLLAVESIAMLGDRNVYRSKLWPLLISKYADDREMGIRGMGYLRSKKAKDAIATMLHDDVAEVRLAAAGELGKFGDRSGAFEVESYLKSSATAISEHGKMNSAMAIGQIQDRSLVRYLPKLLNDRSQNVKLMAAQAVLLMGK